MSTIRVLPGETPDEIDLELLRMGAVDDPAAAARIEEAAAGELAGADAEIAAFQNFWSEHAPGLPELPAEVAPTPAPANDTRGWLRLLAVAAAVLLAVAVGLAAPWGVPEQEGVRAMGTLPVDVVPTRDGEVLEAPLALRSGDELRVALRAPHDGWVDIVALQDDGRVSLLHTGQRVRAGERFEMTGAVRLDDWQGREWLVVSLSETHRSQVEAAADARALLPEPSGSGTLWVLEVTRSR